MLFASKKLNRLCLLLCCAGFLFLLAFFCYPGQKVDAADFSCNGVAEIPISECQALVTLYNQTNGAGWTTRNGWLDSNTPCSWYGIACTNQRISQLTLSNNQLNGTIPPEIGRLTELTHLTLYQNVLTGQLPPEIGHLNNLLALDISTNKLSGALPKGIWNLTNLSQLNLGENQFAGTIPIEISNLTRLEYLGLNTNSLTGGLPRELDNLNKLTFLSLAGNQFSGTVPETIGNLLALTQLHLHDNPELTGPLPLSLTQLVSLTHFNFVETTLCIPQDLAFQSWLQKIPNKSTTNVNCPVTTPTDTPTATPTATSTHTPTATPPPTNATPMVDPTGSSVVQSAYLPYIVNDLPPTPTPPSSTPAWQRIGQKGLELQALALQKTTLWAGDRRSFADGGGLYRLDLTQCDPSATFVRNPVPEAAVLGLAFQNNVGVAAAYSEKGIYITADSGVNWQRNASPVTRPRTVALVNNDFYVGTQDEGIYRSTDQGVNWVKQVVTPTLINTLRQDPQASNLLWVASEQTGVWTLTAGANLPQEKNQGLTGAALQVWDYAFDQQRQIYMASWDGVYVYPFGGSTWQPLGNPPAGIQFVSLEITQANIYAGARDAANAGNRSGVWRRSLQGGVWEAVTSPGWDTTYTVRDLLYDAVICRGLLAATDDGLWLYR